jgi:hypothetical protein
MNLISKYGEKSVVLTLLSLLIVLTAIFKILPYATFNYYYLIGFDSGKYVYDLKYHSSTDLSQLDLWSEPGLNINLTFFNSVANVDPIYVYKYFLPFFVSIFFIIMVYLFAKEITNSPFAGIYASIYLTISTVFLNSTFDSYYRQIFGSIIFMMFLFYAYKAYRNSNMSLKYAILLGTLGAGIIVSHRAITLLFFIILFILFILYTFNRKFSLYKYILVIMVSSLIMSSAYWLVILNQNLIVLKEAVFLSVGGKSGGNSTIKQLARNDNQLLGYLTTIPLSFLPFISLFYITLKKRIHILTSFIIIFLIYIYFKQIFANRFLFNLEILFSIIIGVYLYSLQKILNSKVFIIISCLMLTFGIIFVINSSIKRRPYLDNKTASIVWIENNIDPKKSIFFAPDALSTILTQAGYDTTLYKYPIVLGSGVDPITITEIAIVHSCEDPSLINGKFNKNIDVYIAFDKWNIFNPMPKTQEKIPLDKLDNCPLYEKIYTGDSYIQRIYKLRKDYQ